MVNTGLKQIEKMAVYQYYLAVVPKEGIQKRHDPIPNKMNISIETGCFESDAELYWKEIGKIPDNIILQIDSIVKRANWGNSETSFNWKTYTDKIDNDAFISLDKKSCEIKEFSFRADLREEGLTFLKKMIELGKENNWMFMDRKGELMNADFEEIKESIRNSNAFRFLNDPIKFLEKIEVENQ